MTFRRAAFLLSCVVAAQLVAGPPAEARLRCTASLSAIDFGAVSALEAGPTDSSSSYTVSCSARLSDFDGLATRTVNLCVSYDNGTGGASPGGNRLLAGPAASAVVDLYASAAAGPQHLGTRDGAPVGEVLQNTAMVLTAPPGTGNPQSDPASTTITVFARLFGNQSLLDAGLYDSRYDVSIEAFWGDIKADCAAGGASEDEVRERQVVQATYTRECRVGTVGTLDFGTSGIITQAIDASTSVSVACTVNTPYSVGLSAGQASGATTSTRRLTGQAAPFATIDYGLYRDAARSLNWGNDTAGGSDTQNGTGTGLAVVYPIYGRVPVQDTPEPGDYQDTLQLVVVF